MRRGALGLATAVLSTLIVSGLNASPAAASTTYTMPATGNVTLTGHGYGHGHGMSQYGAQGAALAGRTWQQITSFYYPGTTLSTLSTRVRVKLTADTTSDVVVAARSHLTVLAAGEKHSLPAVGATHWRLVPTPGNNTWVDFKVNGAWTHWQAFAGDGAFYAEGYPIRLFYGPYSRMYRGSLKAARPFSGSTDRDTVNILSMERYLRGVVPSEMPATWHPNAVRSQAVAARTYAAFELMSVPAGRHYDLCDTTSCQVYGGFDAEHDSSNTAIDTTSGVVLTYDGKPAFTQFSSSSGGWTSAGSVPYLPAKQDPYDGWKRADGSFGNPNHNWSVAVDVAKLERIWGIADLARIEVLSRDGNGEWGGRILKLRLVGRGGKVVDVYGSDFRMKLGLKSTYFTFAGVPTKTT